MTPRVDEAERQFEDIVGRLDYPMFIVTAASGGRRAGCLVGFAAQCSISPPRFVVFLSKRNFTFRVARDADALGVHVVPREREDIARLFGEETGDVVDKFGRCEWEVGSDDVPLLAACPDRFTGRILERLDVGDHVGFLLEPRDARADGSSFLPFQVVKEFEPGHEA